MLTDHAVSLDANFSKYGYSAHLRTYDTDSAPASSASSFVHDADSHEKKDWEAERRNGRIMKIYKKVRKIYMSNVPVSNSMASRGMIFEFSVRYDKVNSYSAISSFEG